MNVCVCIKQVPDVSAPMQVRDGHLVYDSGRVVLDAYSASAVEAALVLAEQHGGEVEVVLVGPERATETVRKALAMGAARGTHLITDGPLDSAATARLLADALADAPALILTGKQAQDSDAGLTGAMLAEHLGRPYVTNAVGLALEGETVVVTRQGDAGQEIVALPTPCLVTCSNDMNDPRIPNLKGIMAAKRKPIETRPVEAPASATMLVGYEPVPSRAPGETLDGEPAAAAAALVARLREKAVL